MRAEHNPAANRLALVAPETPQSDHVLMHKVLKIKISQVIAIVVPILAGCATTSGKLGNVALGMSKEQVLKVMGRPHLVSAQTPVEYLTYNLENEGMDVKREYFIKLVNGTVTAYGQKGDFDTTSKPVERQEIRVFKKHE